MQGWKNWNLRQRRSESFWTVVVSGILGVFLAVVAVTYIPTSSLFSSKPKPSAIMSWKASMSANQPSRPQILIDDDEIRTGSIIVQVRRDTCEQRLFDNYTGDIFTVGTMSCDTLLNWGGRGMTGAERLQTIGGAFRPRQ